MDDLKFWENQKRNGGEEESRLFIIKEILCNYIEKKEKKQKKKPCCYLLGLKLMYEGFSLSVLKYVYYLYKTYYSKIRVHM